MFEFKILQTIDGCKCGLQEKLVEYDLDAKNKEEATAKGLLLFAAGEDSLKDLKPEELLKELVKASDKLSIVCK